jgi:hypothetical protein
MAKTFSDKFIVIAILILLLLFIKGLSYLLYLYILKFESNNDPKERKKIMEKLYDL